MRLLSIILILSTIESAWSQTYPPKGKSLSVSLTAWDLDYRKLVEFARIASFGYCVKYGLVPGFLGSDAKCPSAACYDTPFNNIEIIKTFDSNNWGEVGSGFYAIDKLKHRILLVLRGSSSGQDVMTDFDFRPVAYSPTAYGTPLLSASRKLNCYKCKVHNGFNSFLKKNGALLEEVSKLKDKYPKYQLVVVGHSLGAALGLLAGIEFQLMGLEPLVINFGCPRVGNTNFVSFVEDLFKTLKVNDYIEENHDFKNGLVKVVHKNDIVPHLPPLYLQIGHQYYITKKKLPHGPETVERVAPETQNLRGRLEVSSKDFIGLHEIVTAEYELKSSNLWLQSMGKYEHTHYFLSITECDLEKYAD